MKLILFAITFGVAAASGFGLISKSWLIASFAAAYISAIFEESNTIPSGDFKELKSKEFDKSELNIKRKTGIRLVFVGVIFGMSYLISILLR